MSLAAPQSKHLGTHAKFFEGANFLVVKLTDYCNLRCKYCHQDALNGSPVLIPMETFKNAVRLVLKPSKAPKVYIQFHGGEPLLCSDAFFREAVAFARAELETPKRRLELAIQTNLTRLDAPREALLKELGITISYSLDGPPAINDELRGGGRKILENWRRLRANGTEAGTICLIQPSNWGRMLEVLRFFHEEGIHNVRFNLMVPDGRGKTLDTATVDSLFTAKKVILDYMLETRGRSVVDSTLYNAMKRFVKTNGAPSSFEYQGCESLYCQAGRSLFSLNPDGKLHACDRIAESPSWAMGDVNQDFDEAGEALALKQRRAFHQKDDWWARCEGCDAKKICEFSCSAYYVDKIDTREVECQYTKALWNYFLERREAIFDYMAESLSPVSVEENTPLRDQPESTWTIRDVANDAFYNQLSLVGTLAANKHFQLFQRGEQFYLYVFGRDRLFEVDELVAEIARFNGVLSPGFVELALSDRFPKGRLKAALDSLTASIPEVFNQMTKAKQQDSLKHAAHPSEASESGFWARLFGVAAPDSPVPTLTHCSNPA